MKIPFVSPRARWMGAAALAVAVALSGCGGGGSGPNSGSRPGSGSDVVTGTPSSNPPSNGSDTSCTDKTYLPNYTADVRLLHWTLFPLRVYFKLDSNYSAARQALAVKGFNRWVAATGRNGVTYNIVNAATAANVTVHFYDFNGGPGDVLGTTNVSYYDTSNTIDSADISLGITGDNANDLLTATHEFGHALGIYGHSRNSTDLMYFEGNQDNGGIITPLDLNTVLTAYCGNFNKNVNNRLAPHVGELKSVSIH